MLKIFFEWEDKTYTDIEELHRDIVDYLLNFDRAKIVDTMDSIGCDWSNPMDYKECAAKVILFLVMDIINWDVKIRFAQNSLMDYIDKRLNNCDFNRTAN